MTTTTTAQVGPEELERHRRALTGHCYRMLGSVVEAEDAVQETMLNAWRGLDGFGGRAAIGTWLHRIATNVCLDMLRRHDRRVTPLDLGPASDVGTLTELTTLPAERWVLPVPDDRVLPDTADPAELTAARESIRLAFVAALQHLPARQRAVLLLREVLGWSAAEVAELLDSSVASVNSALQRARATLAARDVGASAPDGAVPDGLLADYVDAFERYDIDRLTTLLHEDAVQAMPPFPMWVRGAAEIGRFSLGPGAECRGSRLLATAANGAPAFGQYRSDGHGGHAPWAIHVLTVAGERIARIDSFVLPELFEIFGLPPRL